jgi:hypothetical protein
VHAFALAIAVGRATEHALRRHDVGGHGTEHRMSIRAMPHEVAVSWAW